MLLGYGHYNAGTMNGELCRGEIAHRGWQGRGPTHEGSDG